MAMSSSLWLSELEMDDPIISHHQALIMSVDDHEMSKFHPSYSAFDEQSSMISNSMDTPVDSFRSEIDAPPKMLNYINSCTTTRAIPKLPSSTAIISFEKESSTPIHWDDGKMTYLTKKEIMDTNNSYNSDGEFSYSYNSDGSALYHGVGISQENNRASPIRRTALQAQDHVLAERKRRERLTQSFIALSALVPGLKKMDKATVLGDATKYIKHLQERVRTLEENTEKNNAKYQAVVPPKRSRIYLEEEPASSSIEDPDCCYNIESFPEIEVRISERSVMFRIQSKNTPGLAVKMFSEIEKLHMTIISSNVMPFSESCILITILSQMDTEFCMSANDLVKALQLATLKP